MRTHTSKRPTAKHGPVAILSVLLAFAFCLGNMCTSAPLVQDAAVIASTPEDEQVLGYQPAAPGASSAIPSDLTVKASGTALEVSWVDNSDEDEFLIRRYDSATGKWEDYATVARDTTSYLDTNVLARKSYCYQVVATSAAGLQLKSGQRCARAEAVSTASVETQTTNVATVKPAAPSDLTVEALAPSGIGMSWVDNSEDEEGFRVDRYCPATGWVEYATLGADTTQFADTETVAKNSYCYRVAAVRDGVVSTFSRTLCARAGDGAVSPEDPPPDALPSDPPVTSDPQLPEAPSLPADAVEDYVAAMRALPPLPKPHFSWPLERGTLLQDPDDRRLYEYVRITQAVSFCGYYATYDEVQAMLRVAGRVQADHPELRIHVGVNYSAWVRVFPLNTPPTDFGPYHDAEIAKYRTCMVRAKDWLAQANAANGTSLKVDVLLLDSEAFHVKSTYEPGYQEWNDAITAKNNAFYWVSKEVFPQARVDWYPRRRDKYMTLEEIGEGFSTSTHYMPDLTKIRYLINSCYSVAVEHGQPELTIWVSLASGYVYDELGQKSWSFDKEYDVSYSWQLGAELNDPMRAAAPADQAAWSSVRAGCFFPTPFRGDGTPDWPQHFLAYVRGAHGIPNQP